MNAAPGVISASEQAQGAIAAWRSVRHNGAIQFTPLPDPPPTPPHIPAWLRALAQAISRALGWLGEGVARLLAPLARLIGISGHALALALLALAGLGAAWLLWRALAPWGAAWLVRRRGAGAVDPADWAPDRAAALALLSDADRLAAAGRFNEATHLLLQRSVGEIAAARPDLLSPSSTAREISAAARLPQAARHAFTVIAIEVERSLFALRGLGREDWQRAREAYAAFALAGLEGAAR